MSKDVALHNWKGEYWIASGAVFGVHTVVYHAQAKE